MQIAIGNHQQLHAIAHYSDGSASDVTSSAQWSSALPAVAAVAPGGLVTGVAFGSSTISATALSLEASQTIAVNGAITWPVASYEAEAGQLVGGATIVGASDGSDRAVGDLGGEASGRQAVTLTAAGDAIAWTVAPSESGANAFVMRFSIPDAAAGGGLTGSLTLSIANSQGQPRFTQALILTSRYAWLYGGRPDGTRLYDVPANAATYATATTPTHLYDEIQLKLPLALGAGDVVTVSKGAASGLATATVDFIELETVPAPLALPPRFLSITDARCGAIALDLRHTGQVFDGADDSSYASNFNSTIGINPYNPVGFQTQEKVWYETNPNTDLLQDRVAGAASAGYSMFGLADHNFIALSTCIGAVTAPGSGFVGVYIPPGRFYIRGMLQLPSNITIVGAGMWYSKLVAVDTTAPSSVTFKGVTGIASTSGDLLIGTPATGSSNVTLSNFSMFGNVTQRDVVDSVIPHGVRGQFTNAVMDNLWVEHMFSGLKAFQASSSVQITHSRARNTFADGLDFYGSTSNSIVADSSARSTGDDGVALWSQGTTAATIAQSNTVSGVTSSLQWYGDGLAVYGGNGMKVMASRVSDVLNYPCLQASTQFVPNTLPVTSSMSASIDGLDFYRCGGDGFSQQFGALLIGTATENIDGISVSGVRIFDANYKAIDVRTLSPSRATIASINHVTLTDIVAVGAPACATVGPYTGGTVGFANVCTCAAPGSAPQPCTVTTSTASQLVVTPNACVPTLCPTP